MIAKRLSLGRELLTVAAWQLLLGDLPLLATSALVALLLFLALVGTAFANAYWYWLLGHHEAGELTPFLFLVPLLGLGLAVVLFGEAIAPLTGLGVALTIGGIGAALGGPARGRPPRLGAPQESSGHHQGILSAG